jgi:hypothetical protein
VTSDRGEDFEPRITGEDFEVSPEPRVAGEDFELALHRAELLLSDVDNAHRRLATIRSVSLIFLAVLALAIALLATFSGDLLRASLAVGEGLITAVIIVILVRSWTAQMRKQLRRDELSMIDLVIMLRELWPLVAEEEKWDDTRNKSTQIRLERFPIGAESFRLRRPLG